MSELAAVDLVNVCDTVEEWFLTFENHLKRSPKTLWRPWQGPLGEMTLGMTDGTLAVAVPLGVFRRHYQVESLKDRSIYTRSAVRKFREQVKTLVERYDPPVPPPPYRTAWQHLLEEG